MTEELAEPVPELKNMSKRQREEYRRVMHVFQNRVELKQEFIRLRDDRNSLLDKIKKAERETNLVAEEKKDLEKLLSSPETGYNAIVYYQLRALWDECHEQLERFCEVLKKQQVDRERKREIMEFNREREKRLAQANELVVRAKGESDALKAVIEKQEQAIAEKSGVMHFFNRRKLRKDLDDERKKLAEIRAKIEELFSRRVKIESEQWPEFKGISLKGKRAINIALVAMAQHLYIHFADQNLGDMARQAVRQRPTESHYGMRQDCEFLMEKISASVERLRSQTGFADSLKARADWLRTQAEFKNNNDPVPLASSMSKISTTVGKDQETGLLLDVNVLADDYWGMLSVMVE